jgi:hypothetical protein
VIRTANVLLPKLFLVGKPPVSGTRELPSELSTVPDRSTACPALSFGSDAETGRHCGQVLSPLTMGLMYVFTGTAEDDLNGVE